MHVTFIHPRLADGTHSLPIHNTGGLAMQAERRRRPRDSSDERTASYDQRVVVGKQGNCVYDIDKTRN